LCSVFNALRLSNQNAWYPGTGMSAILGAALELCSPTPNRRGVLQSMMNRHHSSLTILASRPLCWTSLSEQTHNLTIYQSYSPILSSIRFLKQTRKPAE
jgi:hypothetical protein